MSANKNKTVLPSIIMDSVTQKDSSTSKNNNATTDTPSGTEVPLMEDGPKVYVGNLSYKTRKHGLRAFFGTVGKVLSAAIITTRYRHRTRSSGYGFVAFATMEEVFKATKELDNKELDGRRLLVQVARSKPRTAVKPSFEPLTDAADVKTNAAAPSLNNNHPNHGVLQNEKTEQDDDDKSIKDTKDTDNIAQLDDTNVASDEPGTLHVRRNWRRSYRRGRPKKILTTHSQTTISVANTPQSPTKDTDNTAKLDDAVVSDEPVTLPALRNWRRSYRHGRSKKILTPSSETTIFVSNLPYSSTDDTLKDIFKNYQVESIRVVRMPNGQSKGYGFVEMISYEERSNALKSVKNVELEGRLINFKVGRMQQIYPQTNGAEQNVDPDQPTTSTSPNGQEGVVQEYSSPAKN